MRTIAIDCRFAGTGTGLARYTKELVQALLQRTGDDLEYVLLVRQEPDVPHVPFPHRTVVADIPHYSFEEQTTLPALLQSINADLVFFPHFNAPFLCPLPSVVTVHDLILHRYPGDASWMKRMAYRILVHRALRQARRIIAVSAWTKGDIAHTYGPSIAKKTHVIGHGVNDQYVPQSPPRIDEIRRLHSLQKPFFLYVGNCKPHKNVPLLIAAFEKARPDAELVLVSGGDDALKLSLPVGVRLLQNIADVELPMLYAAAKCFVTASLEEGYCLPAAEALACGCPVIASDRTAIPEVVGDHGLLIEPTLDAFAAAFHDPPTLAAPVRVGDWNITAAETVKILKEAASAASWNRVE